MLKRFIQRIRYRLPRTITDIWYNQSVHMSSRNYPVIYDEEGDYIDCEKGILIQMVDVGEDKVAVYEVTKTKKTSGGDWLYPSDAINCEAKFHHVERKIK